MTNMIKAVAMLYSEGANVRIPFEVEFHSGFTEADLDDIVREMFPHLGKFGAYGELIEERNKQMTFEEWWEDYILLNKYELTTKDLKACYEAGWNSCAYSRSDMTHKEYLENTND